MSHAAGMSLHNVTFMPHLCADEGIRDETGYSTYAALDFVTSPDFLL